MGFHGLAFWTLDLGLGFRSLGFRGVGVSRIEDLGSINLGLF